MTCYNNLIVQPHPRAIILYESKLVGQEACSKDHTSIKENLTLVQMGSFKASKFVKLGWPHVSWSLEEKQGKLRIKVVGIHFIVPTRWLISNYKSNKHR